MNKKTKLIIFVLILTGITIVNRELSNVYPLRLIDTYSHTEENLQRYKHVEKRGDKLFVFPRFDELLVFDISDPKEVELKKLIEFPYNLKSYWDVTFKDDDIIIVRQRDELIVVDISTLETPQVVSRYYPSASDNFVGKILIGENVGYVTELINSRNYRLHILDVSDPLAIKEYSQLDRAGKPLEIVQGKYLYLDAANNGKYDRSILGYLQIVDVSDPANPYVIKDLSNYRGVDDVEAQSNYLYIAANDKFYVADITNPANPVEVGKLYQSVFINHLIVEEDYVYFLSRWSVGVIDVSDSSNPKLLGYKDIPQGRDFVVSDGFVYVADDYGLYIYQTDFKANPALKFFDDLKKPFYIFTYQKFLPFILPDFFGD